MIESAQLWFGPVVTGWDICAVESSLAIGRVTVRQRWFRLQLATVTEGEDDALLLHLRPQRRWWQPVMCVQVTDADDVPLGACVWRSQRHEASIQLFDLDHQLAATGTWSQPHTLTFWIGDQVFARWVTATCQLHFGVANAYQRMLCLAGALSWLLLRRRSS